MPHDTLTPAEREHRREHRPGRPSKIDGDPEVRAFVAGRIGELTFDQLAAAAKAEFGSRRAPSRSAVHRWWQATQRRAGFRCDAMRCAVRLSELGLITADDLKRVSNGLQSVVNDGEPASGGPARASSPTATTKETS